MTAFAAAARAALQERGLSIRAAARAVNYDHAFISRVLNSTQQPSAQLAEALDELLDQNGRLVALVSSGPSVPGPVAAVSTNVDSAETGRLVYVAEHPRRVDTPALTSLATVLSELRRLEDTVGARLVLRAAGTHLDLVERLIIGSRGSIRPDVIRLGAQWAQFNGWLATAIGKHDAARRLHSRAAEWGLEAGDRNMVATALSMRGYCAWRSGDLGSMLALSVAAQSDLSVSPGVRVMAAQQEARAHALLGDGDATDRRLDDAFELTARAAEHPEAEPPWIYFFSSDYLAMQRGRAYLYLGRHQQAAGLLSRGIDALPEDVREAEWAASYQHDLKAARQAL